MDRLPEVDFAHPDTPLLFHIDWMKDALHPLPGSAVGWYCEEAGIQVIGDLMKVPRYQFARDVGECIKRRAEPEFIEDEWGREKFNSTFERAEYFADAHA